MEERRREGGRRVEEVYLACVPAIRRKRGERQTEGRGKREKKRRGKAM